MIKQCGNFQNQKDFDIIIGLTMRQGKSHLWSNHCPVEVPDKKNERIKPQHPDTVPNRPKQVSQSCMIDNEARQAYLRQRRAFLIFSRIQAQLCLKTDTMFLAFEIFCKMDHQQFKATHLQCVCMFLAMKYQQIYPPPLKTLVEIMQWDITLQKYRQLQQSILIALKANLNFQLLSRQLQQQLGIVTPQIQHLGLYFLQIAVATPAIYLNHSRLKIIQAITIILKNKGRQHASAELIHICKQLIFSRVEMILRYPFLYSKYSDQCHFYVAQTTLDSQLAIAIS